MARLLPRTRPVRFALLAALPLFALAACKQAEQPAELPKAATTSASEPSQIGTPVSLAPLGRADILSAAAAAADAVAAGRPLPRSSQDLTGQTFELRLPFGCASATKSDWWEWNHDPRTGVLRISVKPQRWSDDPNIAALAQGMPFEAAEGFWIERPWTSSEDCPPPAVSPTGETGEAASAGPAPLSGPNLAIAQFFGPGTPRTGQRGNRPYAYTGKHDAAEVPGRGGFRLKLKGRISGFPDGQPFHCRVVNPSAPPLCIMAAQITGVALEIPGAEETLAEWTY